VDSDPSDASIFFGFFHMSRGYVDGVVESASSTRPDPIEMLGDDLEFVSALTEGRQG
jgi:hypothetical protein